MTGPIFKPAGFLRLATIKKVDVATMTAYITFRPDSPSGVDGSDLIPAQLPISYLSAGGGFIGGYPAEGTPVAVGQAEGASHYFIVAFLARDPAPKITTPAKKINIPDLEKGQITIQANVNGSISLNDDAIIIGEPRNSAIFDVSRSLYLNSFDYSYYIGQGSREINGLIRRNRRPKLNYPSFLRDYDPAYDDGLKVIGMDPTADARVDNSGIASRNPPRIEKHEVVYEYEDFAQVKSSDIELEFYRTGNFPNNSYINDRRAGRADALSLSLVAPNYLMETIKGTVVDLYGNLVDLNRDIVPIGSDKTGKTTLSIDKLKSTINETDTFKNVYEQIKRLERKTLAYHFEINARKEVNGSGPPDVSNRDDYARLRSRFFLDVDKEGQIKMNIPASSENGNIPILARYENYSTVHPNPQSNDPNDLVFNDLYKDVLAEAFANTQVISLLDELGNQTGPIDRFSDPNSPSYIKHGTVYHDISKTVNSLQASSFYTPVEYVTTTELASGRVSGKNDIVTKKITIAGANANGGGRSLSSNFDGSIEINVGANTVDRQSLWADFQGGSVINMGRDLQNISLAANMDGEVLIQVGGATVPAETNRFQGSNTGWIAGVVDIRVYNAQKELTIFRIDNEGMTITTPSRLVMYANQDIMMRSGSSIYLDAENVIINGRNIIKDPGKGPVR